MPVRSDVQQNNTPTLNGGGGDNNLDFKLLNIVLFICLLVYNSKSD